MELIRAPEQVHDAIIAYNNAASNAVSVTASSEDGDNFAANLFNYFTFDAWQPSAGGVQTVDVQLAAPVDCDYFAFYNQNIFSDGGSLSLQYFDGSVFVDLVTYTPTDNSPQLLTFTPVNADLFRIVLNSTNPTAISAASFGLSLTIPYGLDIGFNSPHNAQQYSDVSNISETGNFIGRSVFKEAISYSVSTQLLQYQWFIDNWRPFLRHAERRPFWFKWSNSTYTDETVYTWNDGKIPTPTPTDPHFISFTLPLLGLVS